MTDATTMQALRIASDELTEVLRRIEDSQWTLPTPCPEWDLGQLTDHVTGGNWFTIHILGGADGQDAMQSTIAGFDDGYERIAAGIQSTTEQGAAFAHQGALDQIVHHVGGDMPGQAVLRIRIHEMIIHTWDMAESLAPPATIPAALVDWALADLADPASPAIRGFGIDAQALERAATTDQARLLAAFGRQAGARS